MIEKTLQQQQSLRQQQQVETRKTTNAPNDVRVFFVANTIKLSTYFSYPLTKTTASITCTAATAGNEHRISVSLASCVCHKHLRNMVNKKTYFGANAIETRFPHSHTGATGRARVCNVYYEWDGGLMWYEGATTCQPTEESRKKRFKIESIIYWFWRRQHDHTYHGWIRMGYAVLRIS